MPTTRPALAFSAERRDKRECRNRRPFTFAPLLTVIEWDRIMAQPPNDFAAS